jgi:L-serine dehydratase
MDKFCNLVQQKGTALGSLTIGQCIDLATEMKMRVSDIVIQEAMAANKMSKEEVTSSVLAAFSHNLYAMEIGMTSGKSFLMGTVGQDLSDDEVALIGDRFINKVLKYTLSAQVGNHAVGLQPCAGTGDSCTYTGLVRALMDILEDKNEIARLTALLLKIGVVFREGKSTTGCNMEGFGAGAAATAAVIAEMLEATPNQVGQAITLALSPTIANPCTPRVMVAGLCAAHLGGGVLIGNLAANLVVKTNIPVTVPPDVMIAMAAAVHPLSANYIVPAVIKYMEPFFKTNAAVEQYISPKIKDQEARRIQNTITQAQKEARTLAAQANSIVKPFGDAVVGGSSQAVGSPTNTARIAHALAKGEITGVKVELYPELYARRGINIPGVLMAAVHGASTDNSELYRKIMDEVVNSRLQVEIIEVNEPKLQRVTIVTTGRNSMVEAFNKGGGRLVIKKAVPSVAEAKAAARKLNIDVVD